MREMAESSQPVIAPTVLPDENEVKQWLSTHRLEPTSPWFFLAVMAMMVFTLMLGLLSESGGSALLAVVMTVGLMSVVVGKARKVRMAEEDTRRVHELTVTRQWHASFDLAWQTLPLVKQMPEQYARTLACLAYDLDQLRQYDSALIAYKLLLETLPQEHPFLPQVQTHMAIALLSNDQLADADDRLRKLRLQAGKLSPPVKALVRLADLIQMARTYHFSDVVELEQGAKEMFRPLGVEAGYAYGLMAYARHMLARQGSDEATKAEHDAQADKWWQMATLLVSPKRIVERFGALSVLLGRRATPSPVWESPVAEQDGKESQALEGKEARIESDPRSIA
jgi:tetratricopeptide (TPR) repeat protein